MRCHPTQLRVTRGQTYECAVLGGGTGLRLKKEVTGAGRALGVSAAHTPSEQVLPWHYRQPLQSHLTQVTPLPGDHIQGGSGPRERSHLSGLLSWWRTGRGCLGLLSSASPSNPVPPPPPPPPPGGPRALPWPVLGVLGPCQSATRESGRTGPMVCGSPSPCWALRTQGQRWIRRRFCWGQRH